MNKHIIILIDYKNRYTSKWGSKPYRSGMNKNIISDEFRKSGFSTEFITYPEINLRKRNFKDQIILYTSSEDLDLFYKSYVEDIIYALELQGAILLPPYKLLKAHHNKVFMELLRDLSIVESVKKISSNHFGTLEDYLKNSDKLKYPLVFKSSSGAVSSGVALVNNKLQSIRTIKKHSRSFSLRHYLWDLGRYIKHKDYIRESIYRKKFVLQTFIQGMDKDWKVIIFGEKYFVLQRSVRKGDFRASGSGLLQYNERLPDGLLDFAETFFKSLKVPFLAMDLGLSHEGFVLIEFQAVNFGTHTVDTAPFFFIKDNFSWHLIKMNVIVEKELVNSVTRFVNENQ